MLSLTRHRTQAAHAALIAVELSAIATVFTGWAAGLVMTVMVVALAAVSAAAGRTSISLD